MKSTPNLRWPKRDRFLTFITFIALLLSVRAPISGQGAHGNLLNCREIIVIRHADRDGENLNEKGKVRANALRDLLKDRGITKIIVSHYQRTKETAAPLRNSLGTKCAYIELADRDYSATNVLRWLNNIVEERDVLLIVSHSDVIPKFLALLPGGQPPADVAFGEMYILTPNRDRFVQTKEHYGN